MDESNGKDLGTVAEVAATASKKQKKEGEEGKGKVRFSQDCAFRLQSRAMCRTCSVGDCYCCTTPPI